MNVGGDTAVEGSGTRRGRGNHEVLARAMGRDRGEGAGSQNWHHKGMVLGGESGDAKVGIREGAFHVGRGPRRTPQAGGRGTRIL